MFISVAKGELSPEDAARIGGSGNYENSREMETGLKLMPVLRNRVVASH